MICDLHKALKKEGDWHIDSVHLNIAAEEIWGSLTMEALKALGIVG